MSDIRQRELDQKDAELASLHTMLAGKEQEIVNLRARVAELEGKLDEAKRENADQIYRGNSVAYWHAKAVCYGDICLEVNRILNCPGVDIRDGAKKVVAERDKARADLAVERERADKLQAFKSFVHRRLDEMGVAEDPGGVHSAEGCRIGDRLDIMAQWKARAEKAKAGFHRMMAHRDEQAADARAARAHAEKLQSSISDALKAIGEVEDDDALRCVSILHKALAEGE